MNKGRSYACLRVLIGYKQVAVNVPVLRLSVGGVREYTRKAHSSVTRRRFCERLDRMDRDGFEAQSAIKKGISDGTGLGR